MCTVYKLTSSHLFADELIFFCFKLNLKINKRQFSLSADHVIIQFLFGFLFFFILQKKNIAIRTIRNKQIIIEITRSCFLWF